MFDVNQVSHILKEARIKKNLTQSALAEQLGVTYQADREYVVQRLKEI